MRDLDDLFAALSHPSFRQRFRLAPPELKYLATRRLATVLEHALALIAQRLAPAAPAKDGRQTPYRGHPVFAAQHPTATCCRGCLEKWHRISKEHPGTVEERAHVVSAIERWLREQDEARRPSR